MFRRGGLIEQALMQTGDAEQLQIWQAREQAFRPFHAFAHRADDFEIA